MISEGGFLRPSQEYAFQQQVQDGGGVGDGAPASSPGSSQPQQRDRDRARPDRPNVTLTPVTIRMLQHARQVSGTSPTQYEYQGLKFTHTSVIAQVLSCSESIHGMRYNVEDGTDQAIMAQLFLSENEYGGKEALTEEQSKVQSGMYVKIVGRLTIRYESAASAVTGSDSGERTIIIHSIRPIIDHNEITCHSLDVIHHFVRQAAIASGKLIIKKPQIPPRQAMTGEEKEQPWSMQQQQQRQQQAAWQQVPQQQQMWSEPTGGMEQAAAATSAPSDYGQPMVPYQQPSGYGAPPPQVPAPHAPTGGWGAPQPYGQQPQSFFRPHPPPQRAPPPGQQIALPLLNEVEHYLRCSGQLQSETGVEFKHIVAAMNAPENIVQDALTDLCESGRAYTTIDDRHYKLT